MISVFLREQKRYTQEDLVKELSLIHIFKSIPKGSFIVQKTGCHPMRTRLRLFLEWGITFEEEYLSLIHI